MKISYNWLKEFVDIKVSPQKLADDLSLFGHEVESINKTNNDYILDFEITPNRGDLLSIFGMAREVAALYNQNFQFPISNFQLKEDKLDKDLTISISDKTACPRYTARIIENVKITASPKWIKDRLKSYGFRPINNIVDITNYVMIETGQPLHAFDYDKIKDGIISVDLAKNGESVITLDGKNRELDKNSIIIRDNKKIYDLAGIMGGFNSEISNNTKTIVLQAAIFNPSLIRQTSKRLKLVTDASYRYERGVNPEGTIEAINLASALVYKLCLQAKFGMVNDVKSKSIMLPEIEFNTDRINNLLGTKISTKVMIKHLNRLKFIVNTPRSSAPRRLTAQVPSYRSYDVKIWQDIAEEVARVYGYSRLSGQKLFSSSAELENNKEFAKKECTKDILVKNGFCEVYSYSFVDEKILDLLDVDLKQCRQVINSVTPELRYLRNSLIPSILTAIAKNPWAPEIRIFEIGKVFNNKSEKVQMIVATTGKSDLDLNNISKILNLRSEIKSIDQKVLDYLKIRRPIKYLLCGLADIKIKQTDYVQSFQPIKYRKISEFPPTIRDLAFIANDHINAHAIAESIKLLSSDILFVELFDEFASDKFGKGKKNIAFHVWLQNLDHPFDNNLVDKIINLIVSLIENKYQAKLRGKI